MHRRTQGRASRYAVLAALTVAATLVATAPAAAAPQWHDGNWASTSINCPDGFGNSTTYTATNSYTGFYADANDLPEVGEFFYVHNVTVAVAPCPVGYEVPEFVLPPGAMLAISQDQPVFCYAVDFNTNPPTSTREVAACPQQPQQGQYGYRFGPVNDSSSAWPLPPGKGWDIQVPIRATKELKGLSSSPCDCVQSPTWLIAPVSPNWVFPKAAVFVNDTTPSITYPADASTEVSAGVWRTKGQVNTNYTGGKAVLDIGTTSAYGTSSPQVTLEPGYPGYIVWEDWSGLAPGTTYHWRLRYLRDGKPPLAGADQTFTTPGAPPGGPVGNPTPGGGGTGDPPTAATTTPNTTTTTGAGAIVPPSAPPPAPVPVALPAAATAARAPARVSLAAAIRRGIPVTVSNSRAGLTVAVTLLAPATARRAARRPVVVGRLVRRRAPRGRVVLRVKPTRAGARTLRRMRARKLTIRVRVSGAGVRPATFTRTARLRR